MSPTCPARSSPARWPTGSRSAWPSSSCSSAPTRGRTPVPELLVRGGVVVDATGTRDADVLVRNGVIAAVGHGLEATGRGARTLDAGGCVVGPRRVDLHAHPRPPGRG